MCLLLCLFWYYFFFFKQKTAYEMRISDWSSDVCSSDLICYATTNRQQAVKAIAARCDALLVLGAPNSSNSMRLVEVAKNAGCGTAFLVQRARDIDWSRLAGDRKSTRLNSSH